MVRRCLALRQRCSASSLSTHCILLAVMQVAVRVMTADEDCYVRLEDCKTGELPWSGETSATDNGNSPCLNKHGPLSNLVGVPSLHRSSPVPLFCQLRAGELFAECPVPKDSPLVTVRVT